MSLCIVAYDPEKTKLEKEKFKAKYGISYDKFCDEMRRPLKDDFCYYLHPELLENDTKKYDEMDDCVEEIKDVESRHDFHIGYGHFHCLRRELGGLVGVRYDDTDMWNCQIYYDDKLTSTSLLKFFLHSDCDDEFSADDVQNSYKQFTKFCDKEELRTKQVSVYGEEINDFLSFWKKSADQKLQLVFC